VHVAEHALDPLHWYAPQLEDDAVAQLPAPLQ
jgi:hypothetical protein